MVVRLAILLSFRLLVVVRGTLRCTYGKTSQALGLRGEGGEVR